VAAERQAAEAARREAERAASERIAAETAREEAERAATDRRIAEERAAQQREAARQRAARQAASDRAAAEARVARERELALLEQEARTNGQPPSTGTQQSGAQADALAPSRVISDEDVRTVSQRFSLLERAIESRNITDLISLTEPSGLRIQQFLQMFENSESISARITGLSTRNVSGSITGTLRIDRVTRADGVVLPAPRELASITLTSQWRDGGWSVIDW
jgi:hypothetical protein